jgi:ParB/RepB/Spo0J family partition protein
VSQEITYIPLDAIIVSPQNVRKDLGDLAGLTASADEIGIQEPIGVRKVGGKYEVYKGSRRVAAARKAGHTTIPAIVQEVTDSEAALRSLIENLQRKDLTVVERVAGYKALQALDPVYFNLHELARATGLSPQKISQDFQADKIRCKLQSFGIEVSSDLMPSHEKRQRGEVLPEYHAVLVYQAITAFVTKGVISEAVADEEMYTLAKRIVPLPQAEAKSYIEDLKQRLKQQSSPAVLPVDGDQAPPWESQAAAPSQEDGGQVTCACCEQALTLIHYGDGTHEIKRQPYPLEDQQALPGFTP